MTEPKNENYRASNAAIADDIRRLAGSVSDHTITDILGLRPSLRDIEIAVAHLSGSASEAGVPSSELSDVSERISEILSADENYQGADEESAPNRG